MKKLLFLDVEATGVNEEDRLLQIAYRFDGGEFINEYFNPGTPIKIGAMAIHHVTEKDIAEKPQFDGSRTKSHLDDIREQGGTFVAHNSAYDLGMLAKEGVNFASQICTLKIARFLDEECEMENHTLQYLRYYFGLEIQLGDLSPHDALADIMVLEEVFYTLANNLCKKEGLKYEDVFERMIEISTQPSLIRKIGFGKHRGKLTAVVAKEDKGYLEWLLKEKTKAPEGEEDWIHTLNYFLGIKPSGV